MKNEKTTKSRKALLLLCLVLAAATVLASCKSGTPTAGKIPGVLTVQAADLMEGVKSNAVSGRAADSAFIASQARLAAELFKKCAAESKGENVLVSPLSIQLALAMTANGAVGQTREEMQKLLGGDIPVEALNDYLYSYVNSLPDGEKCKLQLANSIWFRDDENRLTVEKDFLQTNADYYKAQAYKAPFDDKTADDINNWVKEHTDAMIDKIVDEISVDTVMYLINALVFDAEWQSPYEKSNVSSGVFTSLSGEKREVKMMRSSEYSYLEDGKATGFVKNYAGGKYGFAALLPNEGTNLGDYIASLDGEALQKLLNGAQNCPVSTATPRFSYDYTLHLNEALTALGMPTAFSPAAADFSKMASSSRGNIYIGDVLHKTYISVDERGTKAGGVTKVEMEDECCEAPPEKSVILDRPFVYMIVDNTANLPIFIGTVADIQG